MLYFLLHILQCFVHFIHILSDSLLRCSNQDIVIQPKSSADERGAALEMFERLHPKHPYIIMMDRGYDGFNMIEHCNRLNGDGYYVIRTKAGDGGIKEIANLPDRECDVEMEFKVTTSNRYYIQNKDTENIHMIRDS